MTHEQIREEQTWEIKHNIQQPIVECWVDIDGSLTKIIPLAVSNKGDTLTIGFVRPYKGRAILTSQKAWSAHQ